MKTRLWLFSVLVLLGAGWGLSQPLSKIAVSTGYQPLGLIFWQLAIGVVVLGTITALRRKRLPLHRAALGWYLFMALFGTVLPNTASYAAIIYLPSGIVSIAIAAVPMFAFPIALAMGNDRFSWARLTGLALGMFGVVLLIRPEAALPAGAAGLMALALIAPLFYAFEGNAVAKWGAGGLDPVTLLFGGSIIGGILTLPLATLSGQWIDPRVVWAAPEYALVATSVMHAFIYTSYVWLVGRAGATFAAQVSYLVTGFGVLWAILLLGETYAGMVWAALGFMFAGLFLVQPRN